MGSKTSNTSSTQNTSGTTHLTQTPTNPAWVDAPVQSLAGTIGNLSQLDPQSFVAGPSALQNLAAAGAGGLNGTPWNYEGALGGAAGVMNQVGPNIAGNLSKFMDPYLKDVVGATSADLDANDARVRSQQALDLTRSGAFGGSGAALTQSGTEGELARARATTLGNLRSQGFSTALQGATSQGQLDSQTEAQRLAAANSLASIAGQYGDNQRANVALQGDLGAQLQQLAQVRAGAPLSTAGALSGILGSLPLSLFHGDTQDGTMQSTSNGTQQTTTSDPLGSLGSLALTAGALFGAPLTGGTSLGLLGSLGTGLNLGGAGALSSGLGAFMSDRRLKRDIERIGTRPDGLGVYLFRYLWSPIQYIGVMAQEVLGVKPEAVVTLPNGYMAVHYGML